MSSLNQGSVVSGDYKIVDALKALVFLALSVLFIGGTIFVMFHLLTGNKPIAFGQIALSLGAIAIGVLLFKVFQVTAKGFVVDVNADTLEYPGGGIAAESVLSYLLPSYWLQHFRRYTLAISEIREVEVYSETKHRVSDSGKVSSSTTHYLDINGEFGAIQFSFMTKGKRDELYSLLVQMNQMGNPILNR